MAKTWIRLISIVIALLFGASTASAQTPLPGIPGGGTCEGRFVNPIKDVCWECLAPITIGGLPVFPSSKHDYGNSKIPVCLCGIRPGIPISFWEPRRLMDMTKTPWCFTGIGGVRLDPGIGFDTASRHNEATNDETSQWHSHYYIYPLLYWLEFAVDVLCVQPSSFDIGYVTELDPVWHNDQLSLIINPEAVIFANPLAILACSADCVGSAAGRTNEKMFWCQGCEGTSYPLNGNVANEGTMANGALTAAQRMMFKLHKQLIAFSTAGVEKQCLKQAEPLMDKRQYRYQLTYPKAITGGPFTCPNLGFPTSPYDVLGVSRPVKGEDFGVLLWGKRNCCAL